MTKQTFIQGAFILLIANIFVKILGFIYQMLIIRIGGTEAIGLFNMVFPFYITTLVLTTAGLPLAISKMVASQFAKNNFLQALRIFKISLSILFISSISIFLLLLFFSPYILNILYTDDRVLGCFLVMLPGIIIVSISSAFRGFFQGLQDMMPPAITQCTEQLVRFSLGLFLIYKLQSRGIKWIAFGLSLSMIIGEIISLLLLATFYQFKIKKLKTNSISDSKESLGHTIKELFQFGLPTTLTRLISSIGLTLEASLIPSTLQKNGFTINQAASIYGQFSGVSLTLLTIPTVLTFSLATSLIPSISEAEAQGKITSLKYRSTEAIRLTYVLSLPATIILFLKSSDISDLLFNLPEAGSTLKILSLGSIFLYLIQTSNGILQGLGMVKKVFYNTTIGTLIKLIGIVFLVGIPELNIRGAAFSFTISYILVCALNLLAVYKNTGFYLTNRQIFIPFFNALLMGIFISCFCNFFASILTTKILTFVSITLGGIFYIILCLIFKQFSFKSIKNKG